ncbi:MAG TPA: Uma2 family endonuclease [Gemmataceae bacterium]|nr:Uma2 family endonuclease [Gemmataceae bacterium]
MAAPTRVLPTKKNEDERVPPLQTGDRLTAEEFERRYAAMPEINKAELINGVVYMPSPVSLEDHGSPHFDLITWLGVYRAFTTGINGGDNSSLKLEVGANRPQPDAFLRIYQSHGGQSRVDAKGYVLAAPEWIGEIAASSVSYDLHDKLTAYQQNHVREYVVWRVRDEAIDWFVLRGEKLERLPLVADGIYRSEVFPGLWLDVAAMIRRDMPRVFEVAQRGVQSPEHADFVARLQARATQG